MGWGNTTPRQTRKVPGNRVVTVFCSGGNSARSKSGVSARIVVLLLRFEMHRTRINTGENNGRHEETRTPDLYRVRAHLISSYFTAFRRAVVTVW
jgi:hypothetical protein